MHRHGYQGRKLGRKRDQRQALIVGLAESLVLRESIETTLPKAKELISYTEKLISKAKKGGLHNRRQVIAGLSTIEAAHKLVDEIAPKLSGRNSGHLRIVRTKLRRGDAVQLARISFVDDLSKPVKPVKAEKPAAKAPARTRKPATAKAAK
jgi:large subunit ribosomal protein L17